MNASMIIYLLVGITAGLLGLLVDWEKWEGKKKNDPPASSSVK